jgi:uncharacterized protein YjbI with pentapeptide repeats
LGRCLDITSVIQEKERPADLRRRWADDQQTARLLSHLDDFLRAGAVDGGLDLRGAEVGGAVGPLTGFQLYGRPFSDVDLSYGRGALLVSGTMISGLRAEAFQFDRASRFGKATVVGALLSRFKGRFDASDAQFLDCDFAGSTFKGGFNEYGFTRCRFERCNFASAAWKNSYFKACEFTECRFDGARFESCYVAGVKLIGDVPWTTVFIQCDIRSLFLNGERVVG